MYGADTVAGDGERTAFRRAEKKYKLYYDQDSRSSKKKKQPKQVDLSEVLDFKSILDVYNQSGELPPGIFALQCGFDFPVFCLESRPGFYFIPGALSIEEQCQWISESLTRFPQPPNRTNHNAIYGPIRDLFAAAKDRRVLVEDDNAPADLDSESNDCISNGDGHRWKFCEGHGDSLRGKTCKPISALVLLRKLRWSTLGVQFDWSKGQHDSYFHSSPLQLPVSSMLFDVVRRNYNVSLPHNKIPDALCQLSKRLAAPAMPIGEEFRPEAAIVNYFGLGDTLGGHLDDMEADWSKPIVSMSLGCKAIFLLGGKSRDDIPLAMFLRSGDIVLMAKDARECFHGVPRIFTDKENAEVTPLELHLTHENDFLEYIRTSRININIRQVF